MKDILGFIARFGLAAVWLWSGTVKLMNPLDSQRAIAAYQLLPQEFVEPLAVLLPAVEIILGLMLLLGVFLRFAGVVTMLIMVGFIIGLASAWARGLQIDCGCFGGGGYNPEAGTVTYLKSLGRDVGFVILGAIVTWIPFKKFAIHAGK
ncbi:MauE/DoxX family redox-associated membrane protein [Corynebacterium sp. H113]|uniref:MauE/DoxX family redox-associated membrane protein n=1 Tax=Corynebacterium sp. H113 TaxID=3133419 RepID=UPI0030A8B226